MKSLGLVSRLVVATLVAGTVTGLLGYYVLSSSARQALREQVHDFSLGVAERRSLTLDAAIRDNITSLRVLATRQAIASLQANSGTELAVALRVFRDYESLVLRDAAGGAVAAAGARSLLDPASLSDRPRVSAEVLATGQPAVRVVGDGFPAMEIAVQVEDPPGTVAGTLIGRLPLEDLAGLATTPILGVSVVSYIVDAEGRILVHPDRDRVLRGETFPLRRLFDDPEQVASMERAGDRILVAAAPSSIAPLAVVVEQSEAEALAPITTQVSRLTAILLGVLGAAVIVIALAGRVLLRGLKPLREAVIAFRFGNRDARAPVSGGGEIATLAGEFNRMAETLLEHIDEVNRSKEQIQGILDNSTAVIYVKDAKGRFLIVNKQFEKLFDVTTDDVVGKTDTDLFPAEMAAAYQENDRRVLDSSSPLEVQETYPHRDGPHTYIVAKFPLHMGPGAPNAVCGIATDITESKRLEALSRRLESTHNRRHQALQLNDNIIQGLVIAKLALETGEAEKGKEALAATLASARTLVADLLQDGDGAQDLGPGDLVRDQAATVVKGETPE